MTHRELNFYKMDKLAYFPEKLEESLNPNLNISFILLKLFLLPTQTDKTLTC